MKIRIRYVLPALLMLAGCATGGSDYSANNTTAPAVAAPQRVDDVSNAVGAKMDNMLVGQTPTSSGVAR